MARDSCLARVTAGAAVGGAVGGAVGTLLNELDISVKLNVTSFLWHNKERREEVSSSNYVWNSNLMSFGVMKVLYSFVGFTVLYPDVVFHVNACAVYGTYEAVKYKTMFCGCNVANCVSVGTMEWTPAFDWGKRVFNVLFGSSYEQIEKTFKERKAISLGMDFWLNTLIVPGLLKIRYIGQTTVGSAAIFGLFLGAGSLIHCGKSY
ncbi:hypothetical protein JRO89_XS14G0165900 [Xanthoceras sorbifolium]|uniref:Uncharacterized protein n=1 Tax=Xanthoceras sorbifolium TaxID=99658 RepID=A0ABQ8H5L9_9ROSI|nr:hypothetical protein JRO89_XS14G0165900 [Xanthoceras sorbifolium]